MMDETKKRLVDFDTLDENKRIKLEPDTDTVQEELDDINQTIAVSPEAENSNQTLDFSNLPDDLLDDIDRIIATPEVTPNISRSQTPALDDARKNLQRHDNLIIPDTNTNLSQVRTNNELYSNDPSKLNDALAAAGVDIHHEEEYLLQLRSMPTRFNPHQTMHVQQSRPQINLLNPYNVSTFMQKVARENGIVQSFVNDPEILEYMSLCCELWLSNIITKTIIMARHRQRSIPNLNKQKPSTIQRSELAKELRNLAMKQKELEEKRVNKRASLGLEKSDDAKKGDAKGAEESLHNAANATAAMMSMNPGRKKYSWMTAGANTNTNGTGTKDGGAKKSHILAARGENGLRYREIRTGQSVTVKDFLTAIGDEKMGVDKVLLKGYAKMRD